jgi:Tol biopolymer transport system component
MTKCLTVLVLAAIAFGADTAREQKLQQAINLMESKGDAAKAMPMLEDVAHSSDRALAARALLYLGQAQERQGAEKARATYERIVKEFGNQTEMVAAAQQRLAALGGRSETLNAHRLFAKSDIVYYTLSPDGQWIGGTDWEKGDLVLTNVSTGEIRRMVSAAFDKDPPSWGQSPMLSPDQKQVAYWWFDYRDPNAMGLLRVMPNEPGAKSRVVVGTSGAYKGAYPLAWSPDGKRILAIVGIDEPQPRRIAWISATDGSVQVIKTLDPWIPKSTRPRLSPDGHYIAYSGQCRQDGPETCIYALAADGAAQTVLMQGDMNADPVWTPDGSRILFSSNRSGTFGLWSMSVRDGKRAGLPSLLKPDTGTIRTIGMTRSGKVVYSYTAGLRQVFVAEMDPATGKARDSANSVTESFVGTVPAWSRDGKWLAFKRPRDSSGNFSLIIHSMDRGTEWTIASTRLGDNRPVWYLDGSVMPNPRLRVTVSGGQPKEITTPFPLPLGALSPDEKLLYWRPNNSSETIEVVEVATGRPKQMFTVPGGVIRGTLSPDGKTLSIIGGKDSAWHLARIAVDGSGYRELYSGVAPVDPDWTKDGRWILFAQQEKNSAVQRIMRIPAEGGQPEFTGISAEGLNSLQLSPDGSKIAYGVRVDGEEVWALDNVLAALK